MPRKFDLDGHALRAIARTTAVRKTRRTLHFADEAYWHVLERAGLLVS